MSFSLFQMSARIRFRPRITKKKTCADFLKKNYLILLDEKNIPKKNKLILGNKKKFTSYVFLLVFFALINFI